MQSPDHHHELQAVIRETLPTATIREDSSGNFAIGGFSMAPMTAQAKLRAAGLNVADNWGQTTVIVSAA